MDQVHDTLVILTELIERNSERINFNSEDNRLVEILKNSLKDLSDMLYLNYTPCFTDLTSDLDVNHEYLRNNTINPKLLTKDNYEEIIDCWIKNIKTRSHYSVYNFLCVLDNWDIEIVLNILTRLLDHDLIHNRTLRYSPYERYCSKDKLSKFKKIIRFGVEVHKFDNYSRLNEFLALDLDDFDNIEFSDNKCVLDKRDHNSIKLLRSLPANYFDEYPDLIMSDPDLRLKYKIFSRKDATQRQLVLQ